MTELALYPVPVTVRMKPELPAVVLPGLNDAMVVADDETVRVIEFEVLPLSETVMVKEPALVSDEAGMIAVNCEPLT
jgi:hypothetical protein